MGLTVLHLVSVKVKAFTTFIQTLDDQTDQSTSHTDRQQSHHPCTHPVKQTIQYSKQIAPRLNKKKHSSCRQGHATKGAIATPTGTHIRHSLNANRGCLGREGSPIWGACAHDSMERRIGRMTGCEGIWRTRCRLCCPCCMFCAAISACRIKWRRSCVVGAVGLIWGL